MKICQIPDQTVTVMSWMRTRGEADFQQAGHKMTKLIILFNFFKWGEIWDAGFKMAEFNTRGEAVGSS